MYMHVHVFVESAPLVTYVIEELVRGRYRPLPSLESAMTDDDPAITDRQTPSQLLLLSTQHPRTRRDTYPK